MSNFELSDSQINEELTPALNSECGDFLVKFWGVRGLIPTPSSNNSRYGGNTCCVEIHVAGQRLIFDGGTGLRLLGKNLQQLQQPLEAHLFFTNSQSNRIQGFPFFAPAYVAENRFHIYGSSASNGASIKQRLYNQMLQPYFPYPLQVMQSELCFHNIIPDKSLNVEDVKIKTALINKSHCSIGYRVDWQKHSVAYTTDLYKNTDLAEQEQIFQMIQGVDLLIANASYKLPISHNYQQTEMPWKTIADLAAHSGVKKLVISHHHPDDDDAFLDKIQSQVNLGFPNALFAQEKMVLEIAED